MTIKAVLLSMFIYPGSGHLLLNKRVLGAVLIVVSSICLYFLLSGIYDVAQLVSYKILDGEIALDIVSLHRTISQEMDAMGSERIHNATFLLVACWFVGVIDCYRVGKKLDAQQLKNKANSGT